MSYIAIVLDFPIAFAILLLIFIYDSSAGQNFHGPRRRYRTSVHDKHSMIEDSVRLRSRSEVDHSSRKRLLFHLLSTTNIVVYIIDFCSKIIRSSDMIPDRTIKFSSLDIKISRYVKKIYIYMY